MNPDFHTAICEEFSSAIEPAVNPKFLSPEECWDPVIKVLGSEFEPETFTRVTEAQVDQLRVAFAEWFECDGISKVQIQSAISRILARWPTA